MPIVIQKFAIQIHLIYDYQNLSGIVFYNDVRFSRINLFTIQILL